MTTAAAYTIARPLLSSYPLPGFPVPVVTIDADPRDALIDELDSLSSDLEAALVDRDTAARRVTIVAEQLALVRAALEVESTRA
jgi:hypothetical protein